VTTLGRIARGLPHPVPYDAFNEKRRNAHDMLAKPSIELLPR
jgi:hypothetical protein